MTARGVGRIIMTLVMLLTEISFLFLFSGTLGVEFPFCEILDIFRSGRSLLLRAILLFEAQTALGGSLLV